MKYTSAILFGSGFVVSLIAGWFLFPIALYTSEPQPMQFNHMIHTGEQGSMSCQDCHGTNDQGRFQGIPTVAKCAECHASPLGESTTEKILIDDYITLNKEIPWHIYYRQPDNVYFSHSSHVTLGDMKCEDCHGGHGQSDHIEIYQVNRISGYSRDIWGKNISGFQSEQWEGMKMDKCVRCHDEQGRKDGCIACHK